MKFIYVFNKDSKELLVQAGFVLLKEDEHNSVYIFSNNPSLLFALKGISYIPSDKLTF